MAAEFKGPAVVRGRRRSGTAEGRDLPDFLGAGAARSTPEKLRPGEMGEEKVRRERGDGWGRRRCAWRVAPGVGVGGEKGSER